MPIWAAITTCRGWGDLQTTEISFSRFWELEARGQSASMVWWGPSSGLQTSHCILTWQKGRESSVASLFFYKKTNPIHEGSTLLTSHFFFLFINWKFYEIIIDSHAVVRNNTERSLVYFAQFPPMVTFCKTTVNYRNQDIDVNTIHWFYSEFPTLPVLISVCVCSIDFINRFKYLASQPRYWTLPTPQKSLLLPFYNHTRAPPTSAPPCP